MRRVVLELGDEKMLEEIVDDLRRKGVKVRIIPDPEEVRRRIRERWKRTGRRAVPGDLKGAGLEEEFG